VLLVHKEQQVLKVQPDQQEHKVLLEQVQQEHKVLEDLKEHKEQQDQQVVRQTKLFTKTELITLRVQQT
jgi:hypothetical protein